MGEQARHGRSAHTSRVRRGADCGTVTGFTGASGVAVVVSLLSLLCGLSAYRAITASLFVDALTSLAATYVYLRNGRVELRDGVVIGLGSITGARVGTLLASAIPESRISRALGFFTIALGFTMIKRSRGRVCSPEIFRGSHPASLHLKGFSSQ